MQNVKCYSIEDLKNAFEAGRTVCNYKGEWQETYCDDHTSAKYFSFDEYKNQMLDTLQTIVTGLVQL